MKLFIKVEREQFYHGEVIVGLDNEFSVKSHLLIPEGFENNLYSYLLNFQFATDEIEKVYQTPLFMMKGTFIFFVIPIGQTASILMA